MSPDLSPCTNEFGRDRLAAAESYIEAAETIADGEVVFPAAARFKNNTVITNYVHGGGEDRPVHRCRERAQAGCARRPDHDQAGLRRFASWLRDLRRVVLRLLVAQAAIEELTLDAAS